jgi:malonyl-CoA decarboxylase
MQQERPEEGTGMATSQPRASKATPPVSRSWIERLWATIGDTGRAAGSSRGAVVAPPERARVLAEALLSERGEASGAVIARELHAAVREMGGTEWLAFARFLATGFVPDQVTLRAAAEAYLADPTPAQAALLADAAEPPRQELLRRMNMARGGTAALVAMRRQLLGLLRDNPELRPLDSDLRHLFISWFNRGFLELRRIDWQTPAAVLEKLIAYEAVHEIQGWDDLRRRLAPDRRCFGFFHPALPGEPLIFVQVALVKGLAGAVQPLLAQDGDEDAARAREADADTAIFYSISNCQDGLRGVSFGNLLIKQVVEELKAELPKLNRFSTLSPVPGFRRWLEKRLEDETSAGELLRTDDRRAVFEAAGMAADVASDATALRALLRTEGWWNIAAIAAGLREPMLRACATCLTQTTGRRVPPDPVARFHLGNGARLERINWLANIAPRGIKESYGVMVNYLYDLPSIEANHEAFVRDRTVARSAEVAALLAPPRRRPAVHAGE